MSVPVDVTQLSATLADFDFAYLLTVNDDGRAHAVAVTPALGDGVLRLGALGRRSSANAESRTNVSLVFPPRMAGGYSLIVDGEADVDGEQVAVAPTRAVLHRPVRPDGEPPAEGCVADCKPIDLGTG